MIIYCCADLIFATRIRAEAEAAGIVSRPVRDAAMLEARLNRVDDGKPNEPVAGLIVDLDTAEAGLGLIEQTKAFDDTINVLAFGPHVDVERLAAAKEKGADQVLPRGAFTAQLPALLQQIVSA